MTAPTSTLLTLLVALQGSPAAPVPQPSPPAKPSATAIPATPALFTLTIKGGILGVADLQANQVETKAIVERLKTDLKIPINASPIVAQHKVDLTFKKTPTISLLLALAPVVLADLEVTPNEEPEWTAIHLLGYNEKAPPRALVQTGFLLFAGIPREGGEAPSQEDAEAKAAAALTKKLEEEPKDEKPVLVVIVAADGRISLKSRKQPLIAILNEVASKSGIPIDLRGKVDMTPIDVDLRDLPLRDLGVALGRPGIRLVVRRNLATGEEWVQGILAGDAHPPRPAGKD